MKKNIIKIILGILTIIISVVIVFYLSQEILRIHEVTIIKWIPMFSTFIGFFLAGIITKNVKIQYVGILLLTLLIFIPVRYFYFPFVIYLLSFAIWGIILSRTKIEKKTKIIVSFFGVLFFSFFLLNQPLIIEQKEFGMDQNGTLINAKQVWNFNSYEPKTLKNESFTNLKNEIIELTNFENKTIYVSFWATWCAPCIAEKPMLDKLKEEFKHSNKIVFVDISLDKDREGWKSYLEKNKPKGTQLLSKNESLTRRNFELNGIPKHIIVNNKNQYKSLRFIPAAKAYLENEELLNKWIESERLIIEKTE
jgi:thiol-disulfide isomerase/thioredoxin